MPVYIRPQRVVVTEDGGILVLVPILAIAAAAVAAVFISILIALAVAGLGAMVAGLAYLAVVIRRDGLWLRQRPAPYSGPGSRSRVVPAAGAAQTISGPRRLAIEPAQSAAGQLLSDERSEPGDSHHDPLILQQPERLLHGDLRDAVLRGHGRDRRQP